MRKFVPSVTLLHLSDLHARAYLPEARLGQTPLGGKAPIRVDSFGGERFTGQIVFISRDATMLGNSLHVLVLMVGLFSVPISGSLLLLLGLSLLFIVTVLGLGLLVSTLATTQMEAMQFAFVVMLPSVLLSGFMFPRSEMPLPLYLVGFALSVTYFIEILRGIVLRGADALDLVPHIFGLCVCCVVILTLSITRFHKQLV
jgi:ABC-type multidrug transport system permease subunit